MKALLVFALIFNTLPIHASELDREQTNFDRKSFDTPSTLILKKNESTGEVELAYSKEAIPAHTKIEDFQGQPLSFKKIDSSNYTQVNALQELDNDNSRESWFLFWGLGVVMGMAFTHTVKAAPYWGYSYGGYYYTYCYPRYYYWY